MVLVPAVAVPIVPPGGRAAFSALESAGRPGVVEVVDAAAATSSSSSSSMSTTHSVELTVSPVTTKENLK